MAIEAAEKVLEAIAAAETVKRKPFYRWKKTQQALQKKMVCSNGFTTNRRCQRKKKEEHGIFIRRRTTANADDADANADAATVPHANAACCIATDAAEHVLHADHADDADAWHADVEHADVEHADAWYADA